MHQTNRLARSRTRRIALLGLTGMALVAAACGSSKKADTTPTTAAPAATTAAPGTTAAPAPGPTTTAAPATTTAAPAPKPNVGGELKVGTESGVASLDPALALAQPSDKDIALAIYDGLVTFDKDGKYAPRLADSWTNSDDLKTWTLKLHPGVKFQDGTDFNADAVVAHWKRMQDPATQSPSQKQATDDGVPTKVDNLTVEWHTAQPSVGFLNEVAGTMGYIPSPTAVAKDPTGFGLHPVGTGPFKLSSFEAQGTVVVEKNPTYWRKDENGTQLPYLDKITFKPIPESDKRLQAVKLGEVDLIQTADTATVVEADKAKLKVQKVTGSSATIVLFNNKKAPVDDPNVRLALALATDRAALNESIYQKARVEAYSTFAPDSPYLDSKADLNKFDLEKAKSLIKAYGKPVELTLECIPTPESDQILQLLKEQWEAAGAKVTLKTQEQGAYVTRIFSKGGDYQAACFRDNQFVEPDQIRGGLETNNSANLVFYSNPAVDKALKDGQSTTDFAKRKAAYDIVQEITAKEVPALTLLYDLFGNITTTKVSDLPKAEANSLGALQLATVYLLK